MRPLSTHKFSICARTYLLNFLKLLFYILKQYRGNAVRVQAEHHHPRGSLLVFNRIRMYDADVLYGPQGSWNRETTSGRCLNFGRKWHVKTRRFTYPGSPGLELGERSVNNTFPGELAYNTCSVNYFRPRMKMISWVYCFLNTISYPSEMFVLNSDGKPLQTFTQ